MLEDLLEEIVLWDNIELEEVEMEDGKGIELELELLKLET